MTQTQTLRASFLAYSILTAFGQGALASPLRRCDGHGCKSGSSPSSFVKLLIIILAIFGCFLIFAVITIVVTKHRRPKFSDAANRRRELERQRQLDSSVALMGYTGYAQVDATDADAKDLPPTPPSNSSPIPIIKVYPASERSLRRASMSTLESHHDGEAYPRESYEDTSREDQEPILSHTTPLGESVNDDHDSPPPNYSKDVVPLPSQ